ncbi:hypothetical protein IB223_00010 [Pseudoxanthomonas sp. PXM03]|uniref:hypothetical protein n=1 Tax=Pseudoxanthomonas sp. PXM03 TaxID=2769284 RepID=UPI00177FC691|nr:hypothetical protein [Pseudoxanthomonas sp. PXM03]MBD9434468.1 hypothetical protein [Pseudoxanthomonas sp. PXM03]
MGAIVFAALMALISAGMTIEGDWHPAISIGLFVAASLFMLMKNRKLSRDAASHLSSVAIELSDDSLRFVELGGSQIMPTASIASIIVARKAQETRVVYLQRTAGLTVQLEGLEGLGQFTKQLASIIGPSKVKELKWWQFPPR